MVGPVGILWGYFSKGGALMWPIFGVSLVAWSLGVDKWLCLRKVQGARRAYRSRLETILKGGDAVHGTGFEPYDLLLSEIGQCRAGRSCDPSLLFREFLIGAVPRVQDRFNTISAWISVAPLLGLLGTVSGMIQTFRVITDFGLGNPNLTAQGISVALVTTQAGLTVAFPMMLFHNFLVGRSRRLVASMMKDGEKLVKRLRPLPAAGADGSGKGSD